MTNPKNVKKLLHLGHLRLFWVLLEGWITANLKNLYENDEDLDDRVQKLEASTSGASTVIADVTDDEAIEAALTDNIN